MKFDRTERYLIGLPSIPASAFVSLAIAEVESAWESVKCGTGLVEDVLLTRSANIHKFGKLLENMNANDEYFDIFKLVPNAKSDDTVLLIWDDWLDVDRAKFQDVEKEFHNLWFPSADDLDIVEINGAWGVLIDHNGKIKII